MAFHRSDERDDWSVYICCHKGDKEYQTWKFVKDGNHWRIKLTGGGFSFNKAFLNANRWYGKDKREISLSASSVISKQEA